MMNHLSRVLLCLFLFLGATSQAAEPMKEWNFLVFINGVNNLDSYGAQNINQMETVGSTDKMNILVQWGSWANPNVTRLLVQKDDDTSKVTSPVVQSLGGTDMGDWKELVRFVEWANQNYPAKHYFIVVWDHGNGWHLTANNTNSEIHAQDISYDDRTGHNIKTEELGQAMAEAAKIIGHKVDVYASDACLMGMVEVASEMQNSVQYYVGSQDVEPGDGWPYGPFLANWAAGIDTLSAAQVATQISKDYFAAYNGGVYGKRPVTMSAFDLSQIAKYENAFKQVGRDLNNLTPADLKKAQTAVLNTKSFTAWDYRDALDFLDQMEKVGIKPASFANLREAQKSFVLSNDQNQDQVSWGVSVWLPTNRYDYDPYAKRYEGLKFGKNTNWGSFLKTVTNK